MGPALVLGMWGVGLIATAFSSRSSVNADLDKLERDSRERMQAAHDEEKKKSKDNAKALNDLKVKQDEDLKNLQKTIDDLRDEIQSGNKRAAELAEKLAKPVREIQQKIGFVNSLQLSLQQNNRIVVFGPKGFGKSTFLWLLNEGPKPQRSYADGTTKIVFSNHFCDTIGIIGYDEMSILKWVVLMLYRGFPKDIILFVTDRIAHPIFNAASVGINFPLIISMHHTNMWKALDRAQNDPRSIRIVPRKVGSRVVKFLENTDPLDTEDPLDTIYDLRTYNQCNRLNICKPITHHDDIDAEVQRRSTIINPFTNLFLALRGKSPNLVFNVSENNGKVESPVVNIVWRLVYLYEKRYKNQDDGDLKFMNQATLAEFDILN